MDPHQDIHSFLFCMVVSTVIGVPLGLAVHVMGWGSGAVLAVICTVCSAVALYALRDDFFRRLPPEERVARRRHGG